MAQGNPTNPYEAFVYEVAQALVNSNSITTIKVVPNIIIFGKSGASHRIDLYWEFSIAGQNYRTCIECKELRNPVKKSQVASFSEVLSDIGNCNGIFITTAGFQKGARQLAKYRDIRLLVVNPILREVHIRGSVIQPHVNLTAINFDKEKCRPILEQQGKINFKLEINAHPTELYLKNQNGEVTRTFADLLRKELKQPGSHNIDTRGEYFEVDEIGLLPIESIEVSIQHYSHDYSFSIKAENAAKAIIEDAITNSTHYILADDSVEIATNLHE